MEMFRSRKQRPPKSDQCTVKIPKRHSLASFGVQNDNKKLTDDEPGIGTY